jgi:asparaginyl-tRNA synthetase
VPPQSQRNQLNFKQLVFVSWEDPTLKPTLYKKRLVPNHNLGFFLTLSAVVVQAHTVEFLRDMVHLRPRTPSTSSMLRVRHTLAQSIHRYFDSQGFFLVNTPVLTSNDCEGAGELFQVVSPTPAADSSSSSPIAKSPSTSFFNKPVYLTVSGQLHLEAFATALSKVYTFGPTFRAEKSNTPRHLAEFWMLEPEMAPGTMEDAVRFVYV